jgi:hypothetical protein
MMNNLYFPPLSLTHSLTHSSKCLNSNRVSFLVRSSESDQTNQIETFFSLSKIFFIFYVVFFRREYLSVTLSIETPLEKPSQLIHLITLMFRKR